MLEFPAVSNSAAIIILISLLFLATVPPLFCSLAIYRLINKMYRRSSFIATCAIFSLIPALFFLSADWENSFPEPFSLTMPRSLLVALTGAVYAFAAAVGLIFMWLSVFGLVTSFQNRFGDEPL